MTEFGADVHVLVFNDYEEMWIMGVFTDKSHASDLLASLSDHERANADWETHELDHPEDR